MHGGLLYEIREFGASMSEQCRVSLLMAERYERRAAEAATSPALFPGRLSLEKPGAVSAGRTGGSFILTEAVEAA